MNALETAALAVGGELKANPESQGVDSGRFRFKHCY